MRVAALALVALAGLACRRGALQDDAAGTGVIGRDGAMATGDGAGGGDGGGTIDATGTVDVRLPTADANCGMTGIAGGRVPPEILLVLDRAIALDPVRWNSFLSSLISTVTANSVQVDWGLYTFPANGPSCGAGALTTTIDVPPIPDNAYIVAAHIAAAGTGAGGTPAAAAIDVAARYMLSLSDPSPKFLMLITDGAPSCAGRVGAMSSDPAQAQTDALAAITEARAAGIPTFVLAPSTTVGADLVALNALAQAGGQALSPGPDGTVFETEVTLANAFATTEPATSCVFSLAVPPPVPDVVTVTFNGATVPRDRQHVSGWDYTSQGSDTIELYGAWCNGLKTSRSFQIEVYFGCPIAG